MVEIRPLVLRLTLSKQKPICELRRSINITASNTDTFWQDFFEAALKGTPINAIVKIEITDRFKEATRMNELGLLKTELKKQFRID